ncbi:MAG: glycoside hydrolase family 130 protein [Firmicutes bacterium]|nr:glycoside hydrolase family 130 protein [Bacillota bacterium]
MKDATKILQRHPKNPLITPDRIPGAAAVMNPSPVLYRNKTVLLLSVNPYKWPEHAVGTYLAFSDDGVNFEISDRPFIDLSNAGPPFNQLKGIIIDNRVTQIGDTYYIMSPVYYEGEGGPFCLLGKTTDFETYVPIEIVSLPSNRVPSLFPEKIKGKYYRLDRPGGGTEVPGNIWISSSPDLIHWGCHRPLLRRGYAIWNAVKIGPTPPIKTPEGWLVIVHGVWSWSSADFHYYIGAVLLDLEEPERVIGRTYSWLLAPEADYEVRGTVDNVCFPCGAIADLEKDELRLYYGAADTYVCLATGSLSEVIEACKREI